MDDKRQTATFNSMRTSMSLKKKKNHLNTWQIAFLSPMFPKLRFGNVGNIQMFITLTRCQFKNLRLSGGENYLEMKHLHTVGPQNTDEFKVPCYAKFTPLFPLFSNNNLSLTWE